MDFKDKIGHNITEHAETINIVRDLDSEISETANKIIETFRTGKKLIVAGNGGSMADAQHMVAELVNSFFNKNRTALNAITLGVNPSIVSAWGNDVDFHDQFSRELEGIGHEGDLFILISTSGNSKNLLDAAKKAKEKGICTVGLLGRDGGKLKDLTDFNIVIKSESTPRIQEAQQLIYHTLCEIIEEELFNDKYSNNSV